MIIQRQIRQHLEELARFFPIVSLTGPRQAGKTTILKEMFPDYTYLSLEDPDTREQAQQDPRSFLKKYAYRIIFDEAQRVPELFSYLQTLVDAEKLPGRFILSGSQNFLLRQNITQSLAGRVGIARLFPLDFQELHEAGLLSVDYEDAIFRGFYPALYEAPQMPVHFYYRSYEYSYLERDVSGIVAASNLETFKQFIRICAANVGELVNFSSMARDIGVTINTVKSWLSVLEQSYVVFTVLPYFKNFGSRQIKTPKLYFYDTGLLCHLLEIQSAAQIRAYYKFGAIFENLILAERLKHGHHTGYPPRLYFYRDSNQNEIDLLEETALHYKLTEIKSTRTFQSKLLTNLYKVEKRIPDRPCQKHLVYGGDEPLEFQGVAVIPWHRAGRELQGA
jgi:uncharacterized protein